MEVNRRKGDVTEFNSIPMCSRIQRICSMVARLTIVMTKCIEKSVCGMIKRLTLRRCDSTYHMVKLHDCIFIFSSVIM